MSVVVAVIENDVAYVGGDTLVSTENLSLLSVPKVHRLPRALVGVVGDCTAETRLVRVLQAMPPEAAPGDVVQAMVIAIAEVADHGNAEALVAWPAGMVWVVDAPIPVTQDWWAVGAGGSVALGALHALRQQPPRARVEAALEAAAACCPSVGGRLTVHELGQH